MDEQFLKNIDLAFFRLYPKKRFTVLSKNPNLTIKIVESIVNSDTGPAYYKSWDWSVIKNRFNVSITNEKVKETIIVNNKKKTKTKDAYKFITENTLDAPIPHKTRRRRNNQQQQVNQIKPEPELESDEMCTDFYQITSMTMKNLQNFFDKCIYNKTDPMNIFIDKYKSYGRDENFIRKYIWNYISANKNITPEFIEKYPDDSICLGSPKWNMTEISSNKHLTESFIEKNKGICFYNLDTDNRNISESFIEKYIDKKWNFGALTNRVSLKLIEKYIDKPWKFGDLSRRPEVTMEFMKKYPDKDWAYEINPNITIDILNYRNVSKTNDKWFWLQLSMHPGIKVSEIINHMNYPWNWEALLENPTFFPTSFDFYSKYKNAHRYTGLIKEYENKIYKIFDLLCDDLVRIVLEFV